MQLISIETTNFKKLRRFRAEFTGGLNVIVGDNAQGKSTLLQAIECALYGSTVVPGKKDKIPTWGQSSWKVEIEFSINGDVYELSRSKSTAKLVHVEGGDHGDKLVANGSTPVTKAIEELLDLDAKDYNLFMQSKQGETSGVLTFGATALNRKVEAFAGIALIDQVKDLAQERYRVASAQAKALEVDPGEMEDAEQALEAALPEVKLKGYDCEATTQQEEQAKADLSDLQAPKEDPDAMQKAVDLYTRLQGRLERAEQEVFHGRQRVQEAKQRLDEAEVPEDVSALEERLTALSGEVKAAVKEVNDLSREMHRQEQLWAELEVAEKAFDDFKSEDELGEVLATTVEQVSGAETRRQSAAQQVHQISYRLQQIEEMREGAECPTCGTQLSEHDPVKLDEEHAQLVEQKIHAEREREEADKTYRHLEGVRGEIEGQLKRRAEVEAKVEELRDKLIDAGVALDTGETPVEGKLKAAEEVHRGLLVEHAALKERLDGNESQWKQYRRLQRALKTEQSSLYDLQEKLEKLEGQAASAEADGVPTARAIEEARTAQREFLVEQSKRKQALQAAEHAKEMSLQAFRQAEKDRDAAGERLAKLREHQEEAKAQAKAADAAGRLSRFLRERRAGYLQEVWDAVLAAASKQVSMASKGMISRLVYDDGDFLFEEDGVLAPVASASGAQKAHIGVALRIGLSRALYGSDALIIFDEPTESMSEHHAAGLSASLAGAAQQCLLITHREQDQDLAANVVEVAA